MRGLSNAFSVYDGCTMFIVVLLGDPHAGEGGQWGEGGTSSPDGESSIWASNNFNIDWFGCSWFNFLKKSLTNAFKHGGTSWEDDVLVEFSSNIDIALLDTVIGQVLDWVEFFSVHFKWLEEEFWASESSISNSDDLTIWQFIGLLETWWVLGLFHGSFVVKSNKAALFFNVSDNFQLSWGDKVVSTFSEELGHELSEITTCQLDSVNSVGDWETFIDGYSVGNTITWVAHNTGGSTSWVKGEDSLDRYVEAWYIECLEHDLGHLLSVDLWVQWCFSEQYWVLIWGDSQFYVEGVVPDLLHIVPVLNNTMFNWIWDSEYSSLLLGFIT